MDKRQRTIDVINALHQFQDEKISSADIVKLVCRYYDSIKNEKLSSEDLEFLSRIASIVGIPDYFDLLEKFQSKTDFSQISLSTLSSQIYNSTLHTDENSRIHRYQKKILEKFLPNKCNRYFLSASTSFGKTYLVYEILKKMRYRNIVLIFPTIALLSENLEKLHANPDYNNYNIHTLSDVTEDEMVGENIFVYTPERFLSFLEKAQSRPDFDFIFIDEIYKIDNEYIIDEKEAAEDQRDVSYRIAAYYAVNSEADIFFAGPYVEKYSESFERFLKKNEIEKLDYNQYEIVEKEYCEIKTASSVNIDSNIVVNFDKDKKSKHDYLDKTVMTLAKNKENCIVYCSTPANAEEYAKCISELMEFKDVREDYKNFVQHISAEYRGDWVLTECLKKGIGIHHGLIPKYIQKAVVSFFNEGIISALVSTTTITEGVNTSAKNIIVTNNKKGRKPLKRFDAKNIAGRAGRFKQHYVGRIIILRNGFKNDVEGYIEAISHKNYDYDSNKSEIDLFYSDVEFLTENYKIQREQLLTDQKKRGIPDHVMDMFKAVNRSDKFKVYDAIQMLSAEQKGTVRELIQQINRPDRVAIHWDGLQTVLGCIEMIVHGAMKDIICRKTNKGVGKHSVLVPILNAYLDQGFKGLVNFKLDSGISIDNAIRDTARFVYTTSKYHLVKYLGVFNVMYKFHISQEAGKPFEDVAGIDRLLTKLEYNALTELGRKISDYGVPEKILRYYEGQSSNRTTQTFDAYEKKVFDDVERIAQRFLGKQTK